MFAENPAFSGLFVSNRSGPIVELRGTLLTLEAFSSYKFHYIPNISCPDSSATFAPFLPHFQQYLTLPYIRLRFNARTSNFCGGQLLPYTRQRLNASVLNFCGPYV